MMTYRRTGLSLCLAACLALVGCDGDGKSTSDTDVDSGRTQDQQRQQAQAGTNQEGPDQEQADEGSASDERRSATSKEGVVDEKAPLHVQEVFVPNALAELFEAEPEDRMKIPGIEPSPRYNSQRLTFEGHEGFGLGLQVWAFEDPDEAESRFEELRKQYLNVGEAETVPDKAEESFASQRGSLKTIVAVFVEPAPRIMAVTCDESLCSEQAYFEELIAMAGKRLRTTIRD